MAGVRSKSLSGITQSFQRGLGISTSDTFTSAGLNLPLLHSSCTVACNCNLIVELLELPFAVCCVRHTELQVLVPRSQASVGLHCFNLDVHRVTVNGMQAEV